MEECFIVLCNSVNTLISDRIPLRYSDTVHTPSNELQMVFSITSLTRTSSIRSRYEVHLEWRNMGLDIVIIRRSVTVDQCSRTFRNSERPEGAQPNEYRMVCKMYSWAYSSWPSAKTIAAPSRSIRSPNGG